MGMVSVSSGSTLFLGFSHLPIRRNNWSLELLRNLEVVVVVLILSLYHLTFQTLVIKLKKKSLK